MNGSTPYSYVLKAVWLTDTFPPRYTYYVLLLPYMGEPLPKPSPLCRALHEAVTA